MYYRGAAAAIIVYDITRANTFDVLKNWVEELRSKGPKDIAIAIAGNKADLEGHREVDKKMAATFAEDINAIFLETSAKDDLNVQSIFVQLSKCLYLDLTYPFSLRAISASQVSVCLPLRSQTPM
ncbi:MAG: hypothetical protein RIS22_1074 [Actinomycetota bacterium]